MLESFVDVFKMM